MVDHHLSYISDHEGSFQILLCRYLFCFKKSQKISFWFGVPPIREKNPQGSIWQLPWKASSRCLFWTWDKSYHGACWHKFAANPVSQNAVGRLIDPRKAAISNGWQPLQKFTKTCCKGSGLGTLINVHQVSSPGLVSGPKYCGEQTTQVLFS